MIANICFINKLKQTIVDYINLIYLQESQIKMHQIIIKCTCGKWKINYNMMNDKGWVENIFNIATTEDENINCILLFKKT